MKTESSSESVTTRMRIFGLPAEIANGCPGVVRIADLIGLVSVAAPARDFKGQLVEALNVSAPKFHLGGRLEGAGELSTLLCGSSGAS